MTDHDPLDDRATRQIELSDPDGKVVSVGGATVREQLAKVAELQAQWDNRRGLSTFVDRVHNLTDRARSRNWEWLDSNCHPTVAQIPFVLAQSPNAGTAPPAWGTLTTSDKAEALRLGVSLALVETIRMSQAIDLMLDKLQAIIVRDPTLTPPPDR